MRIPVIFRNLGASYLLAGLAFLVLVLRLGHPYHRIIALVCYGISWVPFVFSFPRRRALVRLHRMKWGGKLRTYLPHMVMAALLVAFAYVAKVLVPVEHSPLTEISEAELKRNIKDDADTARYINAALAGIVARNQESRLMEKGVADLTPEEKQQVLGLWSEYLQTGFEVDLLQKEYKGFYQIDFVGRPKQHATAFLNAFYSFVCLYRSALEMVLPTKGSPSMTTFLNEAHPTAGIPANSLFNLNQHLTHQDTMLRMNAGRAYLQFLKKELSDQEEMVAELEANLKAIDEGLGSNLDMFFSQPLKALEHHAFQAWFPVQKQIAVQMSHLRAKDRAYFVQPVQLESLRPQLQPGDILVQRRNWHITNAGIPGFWPHLALYTGNLDEMDAFFAEVDTDGVKFSDAVKSLHPEVHTAYQSAADQRVIEAKRDGVIVQSLAESGNCDYLAVLRPRAERKETMNALLKAFKQYGKPYDYNFDFATDSSLVCSELIYKAYLGCESFKIEPVVLNGRLLFPPNELVRQFDQQFGQEDAGMDFVAFLDGNEAEGKAVLSDAATLRETWTRMKWSMAQE